VKQDLGHESLCGRDQLQTGMVKVRLFGGIITPNPRVANLREELRPVVAPRVAGDLGLEAFRAGGMRWVNPKGDERSNQRSELTPGCAPLALKLSWPVRILQNVRNSDPTFQGVLPQSAYFLVKFVRGREISAPHRTIDSLVQLLDALDTLIRRWTRFETRPQSGMKKLAAHIFMVACFDIERRARCIL